MTNKEAIKWITEHHDTQMNANDSEAMRKAIKALELLDTLTDRPCSVCRHHKERTEFEVGGCCKWDCVFDGYYGGKNETNN